MRQCFYSVPARYVGSVFPDPRLVAAIVDRVTFNAHILKTGIQSYRLHQQGYEEAAMTCAPRSAS